MLNEFGSYADVLDNTKNDINRKTLERGNCCGNGDVSRPANLPVPATWNCNPYFGNLYNYYGNNGYDLSPPEVPPYDTQKCANQFGRNYTQIQSASVLQCCDPRCQLFDHSKYPFSNTLANKYNAQRKHVQKELKTPYVYPTQNDLKYNQQQNYMYQNAAKPTKHVLLPESSSFGEYYTDIGKPSYWNKQNVWNRPTPSYYPYDDKKNQTVNQRGILFNRLLDRNRYEGAGYMPNHHYGRNDKTTPYYQPYPTDVYDCNNTRVPMQNNSYQSLPLYNVYVDPANQCKDKVDKTTRITDKNPNLDVREFLSTWDEVEDEKAPEPETPVIVLDCTSLEGDALAKVKEKLGDVTDCPIETPEFNSHTSATVLKVVDDQVTSPRTTVIQENAADTLAKCKKDDWYGAPKKDISYDLVEMTERLVNTVDKLFGDEKNAPVERKEEKDDWNINLNYKRNKPDKAQEPVVEPEKNVSCSFNLQKTSNDLKFSVNYSKQTEQVQDYSVKYKNTCDAKKSFREDYSYKNYYNSYYYNNPSCEYMQMENVKECTYDVETDDASDITSVKADLEKSLKEITHQFSYQETETRDELPKEYPNDENVSVIQKTGACDESPNENSLLSMPSLSPPPCATPEKSVGLTLNDVYENDVLFDTESRFGDSVYPLNLAVMKDTKDGNNDDVTDQIFKADDGYYSVENQSDNVTETDADKKEDKPAYKTCIVSTEQYQNVLPRLDGPALNLAIETRDSGSSTDEEKLTENSKFKKYKKHKMNEREPDSVIKENVRVDVEPKIMPSLPILFDENDNLDNDYAKKRKFVVKDADLPVKKRKQVETFKDVGTDDKYSLNGTYTTAETQITEDAKRKKKKHKKDKFRTKKKKLKISKSPDRGTAECNDACKCQPSEHAMERDDTIYRRTYRVDEHWRDSTCESERETNEIGEFTNSVIKENKIRDTDKVYSPKGDSGYNEPEHDVCSPISFSPQFTFFAKKLSPLKDSPICEHGSPKSPMNLSHCVSPVLSTKSNEAEERIENESGRREVGEFAINESRDGLIEESKKETDLVEPIADENGSVYQPVNAMYSPEAPINLSWSKQPHVFENDHDEKPTKSIWSHENSPKHISWSPVANDCENETDWETHDLAGQKIYENESVWMAGNSKVAEKNEARKIWLPHSPVAEKVREAEKSINTPIVSPMAVNAELDEPICTPVSSLVAEQGREEMERSNWSSRHLPVGEEESKKMTESIWTPISSPVVERDDVEKESNVQVMEDRVETNKSIWFPISSPVVEQDDEDEPSSLVVEKDKEASESIWTPIGSPVIEQDNEDEPSSLVIEKDEVQASESIWTPIGSPVVEQENDEPSSPVVEKDRVEANESIWTAIDSPVVDNNEPSSPVVEKEKVQASESIWTPIGSPVVERDNEDEPSSPVVEKDRVEANESVWTSICSPVVERDSKDEPSSPVVEKDEVETNESVWTPIDSPVNEKDTLNDSHSSTIDKDNEAKTWTSIDAQSIEADGSTSSHIRSPISNVDHEEAVASDIWSPINSPIVDHEAKSIWSNENSPASSEKSESPSPKHRWLCRNSPHSGIEENTAKKSNSSDSDSDVESTTSTRSSWSKSSIDSSDDETPAERKPSTDSDTCSNCDDETKLDDFNIPSVAPTPHCDLNKEDEDIDTTNEPPKLLDVISKAPSPNCVLHEEIDPKPYELSDRLPVESSRTYFSDNCSISSVAPSPNCDIIDGVLLDDTDRGEDFETVLVREIPSLCSLAAKQLEAMSFNSIPAMNCNNVLEVWVTPERTEIIIRSEDEPDPDVLIANDNRVMISNDNHVMIADAYDEDVNMASNFEIKDVSLDYTVDFESMATNEKSEDEMQCQCLIISSEESVVCLRCSLNSSIIVNQDLDYETSYQDPITLNSCSPYANCIEDSCVDQRIAVTPEPRNEISEDKQADNEERISDSKTHADVQVKVQLPWHKIFNLGQEDGKTLELGPAKVQVRLPPEDGDWKVNNGRASPVVNVKRLVLQRAADLEKPTEPKTSPERVGRLPKMVIKKTSCKEYKSFLRHNVLQPVVRLYKNKYLDELAVRMQRQNNSSIRLSDLENYPKESVTDIDLVTVEVSATEQSEDQPVNVEKSIEDNPVTHTIAKAKRQLAPKPEYHHCLLCHRSYTSLENYQLHLKSRYHCHLELTQRKTIHAMYRHFTGHVCPRLRPLTVKERKKMKWKPRSANVNHFYHEKTPLQIALHVSIVTSR